MHEVKTTTEETPKIVSCLVLIPRYLSLILCTLDLKAKVSIGQKQSYQNGFGMSRISPFLAMLPCVQILRTAASGLD